MNRFAVLFACLICAACSRGKTETAAKPEQRPTDIAQMTLEAQDHFGLQWSPAKVSELTEYLQVTGTVQPAGSRVTQVRPMARGRVLEVFVRVGDRVAKGAPLARFDNIEAAELSSQLASARAELERLKIQSSALARQSDRSRRLAELGAVPRKESEQALADQQAMGETLRAQEHLVSGLAARLARFGAADTLRAPFAGIVIKADTAPGAVVSSETELFTIGDLSVVWVQAEVYEKDLGRIRVGQTAQVTVDTYPDTVFNGKVAYIADVLDAQTRTAKVRCEVPNPGARLKLDMFAGVRLPTTFSRRALAVPSEAVLQLEGRDVVFVRLDDTRFQARQVTRGRAVDGRVEILSGLREGETVVTEGAFHVKSMLAGGVGEE